MQEWSWHGTAPLFGHGMGGTARLSRPTRHGMGKSGTARHGTAAAEATAAAAAAARLAMARHGSHFWTRVFSGHGTARHIPVLGWKGIWNVGQEMSKLWHFAALAVGGQHPIMCRLGFKNALC